MSVRGLLGKKVGMTQIFDADGSIVPVTVLSVQPNVVSQVKSVDRDGYSSAQLAFEDIKVQRLTRPQQGHLAAAGVQPKRYLREVAIQDGESVTVGDEYGADVFVVGEKVQISGTSKGKGFAGVVKRFHFHGGDMTHGSMIHRKPQSGGATDAARTFKGTRKPGRMGNETVTQQGLRVVQVDTERNLLLVRGAVPGANGGLVIITKAHHI
jgi:large subunit ribosomal protein L3